MSQFRREGLSSLADPSKRLVEHALQVLRQCGHGRWRAGFLDTSSGSCGLAVAAAWGLAFAFRSSATLFSRDAIYSDILQAIFWPFAVSSIPAIWLDEGLEPEVEFTGEGLVDCLLDRRALLRGKIESAAYDRRVWRCLERFGETGFCLDVYRPQSANEHFHHALFQTGRREIVESGLARDREDFLLGAAADGLTEIARFGL